MREKAFKRLDRADQGNRAEANKASRDQQGINGRILGEAKSTRAQRSSKGFHKHCRLTFNEMHISSNANAATAPAPALPPRTPPVSHANGDADVNADDDDDADVGRRCDEASSQPTPLSCASAPAAVAERRVGCERSALRGCESWRCNEDRSAVAGGWPASSSTWSRT
eukprot:6182015-Pleurochrysis_carterae.AAC.2